MLAWENPPSWVGQRAPWGTPPGLPGLMGCPRPGIPGVLVLALRGGVFGVAVPFRRADRDRRGPLGRQAGQQVLDGRRAILERSILGKNPDLPVGSDCNLDTHGR